MAETKNPSATKNRRAADDARLFSPSSERNKGPLFEALSDELVSGARVLEIASGSGEHAVHFCTARPDLIWQPSDIAEDALTSIAAWRTATNLQNIMAPLILDVTEKTWWRAVEGPIDFVLSCNMIHISPQATMPGLIAGAGALLGTGGMLALYGPFKKDGIHNSASNEEFDRSLKSRDPQWGIRDIDDIVREANRVGISFEREVAMPANNRVLLFRKDAP